MSKCDVCGKDRGRINIHSAYKLPTSFGYCSDCDSKNYLTLYEIVHLCYLDFDYFINSHKDFISNNLKKINKDLIIDMLKEAIDMADGERNAIYILGESIYSEI